MAARRIGLAVFGLLLAACSHGPAQPASPVGANAAPPPTTGALEVRVTDALDGKPITKCSVVGWDAGTSLGEVMPSGDHVAVDGLHRFVVPANLRRVRIAATGYTETWSGNAGVAAGHTKQLAVSMNPLSRLVVRLHADESAVPDGGALLLTGPGRTETMVVKNGLADQYVDAGTVDVRVDPDFLPGFNPQRWRMVLKPGERTDLALEVGRQK